MLNFMYLNGQSVLTGFKHELSNMGWFKKKGKSNDCTASSVKLISNIHSNLNMLQNTKA